MITAGGGGDGHRVGSREWGWGVAARGLEAFNRATDVTKVVGGGLVNVVGVGLQQLGSALSHIGRR